MNWKDESAEQAVIVVLGNPVKKIFSLNHIGNHPVIQSESAAESILLTESSCCHSDLKLLVFLSPSVPNTLVVDIACTIATRVGELEQTDASNLQPLNEAVDVEALEQVIKSIDGMFHVQLAYSGYTVTILGEDEVSLCAITEDESVDSKSQQTSR